MQIHGKSFGAVEECGNTPSSKTNLIHGNFTVIFRTSEDDAVGYGFEMYVICYKPAQAKLEGTTLLSLYNYTLPYFHFLLYLHYL